MCFCALVWFFIGPLGYVLCKDDYTLADSLIDVFCGVNEEPLLIPSDSLCYIENLMFSPT